MNAEDARSLGSAAREAGVVHAVTFNYRGNPLVQQAREMIRAANWAEPHFVHGAYLQDWLLQPTDFSWRLEPEKGGKSSAIRRHRLALVRSGPARRRPAHRSGARRPETVVATRFKPRRSAEAFAGGGGIRPTRGVPRAERGPGERAACASRAAPRAACRSGQVCAGHKNDLWFEVNGPRRRCAGGRNSRTSCGSADATRRTRSFPKDPALLSRGRAPYAHLPGGHQEAWADAFCNVMRDIYRLHRRAGGPGDGPATSRLPRSRTVTVPHASSTHAEEPRRRRRLDRRSLLRGTMKLGLFTPVFAVSVSGHAGEGASLGNVRPSSWALARWPGSDHVDVDGTARQPDARRATSGR